MEVMEGLHFEGLIRLVFEQEEVHVLSELGACCGQARLCKG